MKNRFYGCLLSTFVVLFGCSNNPKQVEVSFINPPLKGIDIAYEAYTLDAERGDTLYCPSGSILLFPPNAFVDKNGAIIKGEVKVEYREFNDPIDFFVAGISMAYDSAGVNYQFESSGMCEILASQKGEPLFVNPQSQPLINLKSMTTDATHRIYYLDTLKRAWSYKAIPEVAEFTFSDSPAPTTISQPLTDAPVKPLKESGERPTFTIKVEPGSVPELDAYNHLKFEVAPDDKSYDPKYGTILWEDVSVKRGKKKGTYEVTFMKGDFSISFMALPVIDAAFYDAAMKTYRDIKAEYDKMVAQQLEANKKQLAENEKTDTKYAMLNLLIQRRNERVDTAKQKRLDEQIQQMQQQLKKNDLSMQEIEKLETELRKKELELQRARAIEEAKRQRELQQQKAMNDLIMQEVEKKKMDLRQQEWDQERARAIETVKRQREQQQLATQRKFEKGDVSLYSDIYRSFRIDGFGVWNSDYAFPLIGRGAIKIKARFVDEQNQQLCFNMIQVVYKSMNGINANHNRLADFTYEDLDVIPDDDNMMWSVINNRLYYLTYDDFRQYQIKADTVMYDLKMRVGSDSIKSIEDLRRVLTF